MALSLSAQELTPDSVPFRSEQDAAGKTHFITEKNDTLRPVGFDSLRAPVVVQQFYFKPNPTKSVWYALICPGLGQIYNRRYWKVPIVYAGFAGLAYGIGWNGKYYNDYLRAYRDISDSDPKTKSYENLLPPGYNESNGATYLNDRQNSYRRYRDLCIVGAVAFYALTVIDAFVDAQLADFDISPDLSMRVGPTVLPTPNTRQVSLGVQMQMNF